MAHVKAETIEWVCCNRLRYPIVAPCEPQDERHIYCDRKYGDLFEIENYCPHSKLFKRFIERDYKRFSACQHESNYDFLDGCYDLSVSNRVFICSYLEIDGHIYCDVRDELDFTDPREEVTE